MDMDQNKKERKIDPRGMILGILIGIGVGTALNNIPIGVGVGVALGAAFTVRTRKSEDEHE